MAFGASGMSKVERLATVLEPSKLSAHLAQCQRYQTNKMVSAHRENGMTIRKELYSQSDAHNNLAYLTPATPAGALG